MVFREKKNVPEQRQSYRTEAFRRPRDFLRRQKEKQKEKKSTRLKRKCF